MNGSEHRLKKILRKEEQHDRRKRSREINKKLRKNDDLPSGKSGYKKTKQKFDTLT
ncbi:MAG: hypothetical protein NC218_02235 [Acetobacter sp.]|nr:hypothetical protein [Acetobacter sp.]